MTTLSPTQRSVALLRGQGYHVAIVEHWNAHVQRRQDLFGFIDLIALRDGETLAVQTTTGPNVASRLTKIAEHPNLPVVRAAGWSIHVHGWRKVGKPARWDCRIIDVS